MIGILMRASIRTVQGEIWIRRMGMGDLEYRVEPTGNDEITKALEALETLRQSSLRAMQLDQVRLLSQELREKNAELESTLEKLRSTQDRIISQQKLAELGELSAGVAHEIRNPLQFIKNFTISSELLISELKTLLEQPDGLNEEEARDLIRDISENLERVTHHSDRANGIVSGMLTLDRGTGGGFRPVDLNRLVTEQTDLAHGAVQAQEPGFSTRVNIEKDPDLGEVTLVPEDIARVIVNLVTNACQAMAEKAPGACENYMPELLVRTSGTGDGVTITVLDNGPGVTPEIARRMFIPFFTTRDTALNTGLGLSLAHDIAREHADKGMYFIWDFTQLNVRPHSRVGLLKYKTAPKCSLSGPFRHSGVGRNPGAVGPVRSYNLNFTYPYQPGTWGRHRGKVRTRRVHGDEGIPAGLTTSGGSPIAVIQRKPDQQKNTAAGAPPSNAASLATPPMMPSTSFIQPK